MEKEILKLRKEGKSYNEIKEILDCSKSTISYYCGKGQKEKAKLRTKKRRKNLLITKVDRFRCRKTNKDVMESIRKFQKKDNNINHGVNKDIETTFTWEDVINKFGQETKCYLSGENINLFEKDYQLDHIIPSSRGGNNSLNNLGVLHKVVNQIKGDLTPDELIEWCVKILKYNNYIIKNTGDS